MNPDIVSGYLVFVASMSDNRTLIRTLCPDNKDYLWCPALSGRSKTG